MTAASATTLSRPMPDTRNAGVRFWRAAAEGRLLIPNCNACARTYWHPRPRCPHCGSANVDWIESAGHGVIHTWTIVRQSSDPYFATKVPYAVAMIEIDGVRMMSNIVETPLDALRIGLPVDVTFETAGEIGIPLFRATAGEIHPVEIHPRDASTEIHPRDELLAQGSDSTRVS